jgi:hypothetical protein
MRTLLKVLIPVEAGNKGVTDGSLPRVVQQTLEMWKPEAAYFYTENGMRAAIFVVDLQDSSQIPAIAEPFFMTLNAQVSAAPVMNAHDLRNGLEKIAR